MRRLIIVVLLFALGSNLQAQEIFSHDFEDVFVPEGWQISDKSEWGHELGEEGSSFFRFHPFSYRDFLQSPPLELEEGYYVFYFSWNEAQRGSPDFCNVRIKEGDNYWDRIYTFGSGNNRTWERDSAVIGNLDASTYTIEFEYKSLPRYPAQYLNIDNIELVRSERVVSASNDILEDLSIQILPNPVHEELFYDLKDSKNRRFDLTISNSGGQQVLERKAVQGNGKGTIDVSHLPSGIYILEFRNDDGVKTDRFVIH